MKLMSVAGNITSLTMVLTIVFMIVMASIYFRKKINETENKIESMFDLVETLTNEVKNLKLSNMASGNGVMGNFSEITHDIHHTNVTDGVASYEEDFCDEDEEDEEDEDDSEDEDEDDSEDEDEDDAPAQADAGYEKMSEINVTYGFENASVVRNDYDEDADDEGDDEPRVVELHETSVKNIDLSEVNVESELNDVVDHANYTKMTVKELKQLLTDRGNKNDITKLKRSGLINLLKEE